MKATTKLFAILLFAQFVMVAVSLVNSWGREQQVTRALSPQLHSKNSTSLSAQTKLQSSDWTGASLEMALVLCGAVCIVGIRLRRKITREAISQEAGELALERRVEERMRDLRQEVEQRRQAEQLNRGQRRILDMLSEPKGASIDEILHELAATVASRQQGWECAVHTFDQNSKHLRLAASSEVNDNLTGYFDAVGREFNDSPECQAAASGEIHAVDQLSSIGLLWSQQLVSTGIFSACSIPFCASGTTRLAGTLTVYSRSRTLFSNAEIEMAESAAKLASLAIDYRHLHTELVENRMKDALTGLPNRRAGEQAIEEALQSARRRNDAIAVMWVDINRFKRINEQYGHEAGDHVLRTIAERLRRNPACTGTVARMGEDEFMVLIPGTTDSLDPLEISRRLSAALSKPIYAGAARIAASASIGSCMYPRDGETFEQLAHHAEFAMYKAKSVDSGYSVFSQEMNREASEHREIEEALSTALEKNYLSLAYQPLFSQEGELTGFEALLRFKHPKLGYISPAVFIPIAEETRQIVSIGNWVLHEACRQLKEWHDAGLPKVRMSVNISALQFTRDDFADSVATVITDLKLNPEYLVLELTESMVIEDYDAVVRQMNLLRQCGIHIAMDDFGTGYSSLSYIHRIPVDVLKIDRSFIERVTDPEGTRPIVEAVIYMAKCLGLSVVAEGVETQEQRIILEKAGCNGFQGYLFAKPLTPADAEACLRKNQRENGITIVGQGGALAVA